MATPLCTRCSAFYSPVAGIDRKSTRLNSSHSQISYAVFCLKKKHSCSWWSYLVLVNYTIEVHDIIETARLPTGWKKSATNNTTPEDEPEAFRTAGTFHPLLVA